MKPAEARARPHLVAKIGGSLCGSPLLAQWIAALERYPHALTIISGGGPFADAVRAAQPAMKFSDGVAHQMALLAMEQYALALAGLFDGLDVAATHEEIAAAHARGRIALWRPAAMVGAARDIAPGWETTSDSLAAWLARETRASALLVIKSVDVEPDADLVRCGVVDSAFPTYVDHMPTFVAGPAALATAAALLAGGAYPGARVEISPMTRFSDNPVTSGAHSVPPGRGRTFRSTVRTDQTKTP